MADILHIDFETYSACDLKKAGVHAYAEHPTTGVWCAAYAFDDGPVQIWVAGEPCPPEIDEHIRAGRAVWAHNAVFERLIIREILFRFFGWPALFIEQTHCTMAMAMAMALPPALDRAAAALGMAERKDHEGHRIMKQLAAPIVEKRRLLHPGPPKFCTPETHWELHVRLREYCKQDLVVERGLGKRLLQLSARQRRDWILNERMNDRGIAIDIESCKKALAFVEVEVERLNGEIHAATDGAIHTTGQNVAIVKWLQKNGLPQLNSLAKDEVLEALLDEELPPRVRKVLSIRQEAAKSSTKKIKAMLESVCKDGRARGTQQWCAAFTGRAGGRRLQPHNLPRPILDYATIQLIFDSGFNRDFIGLLGRPMHVLSDCLRSFLISAPGKTFVSADLAQIEARVLAWLAGQEDKLQAFREGKDLYCTTATNILRVLGKRDEPVTKKDATLRQNYGKTPELACGYQGGKHAFVTMGKNLGTQYLVKDAIQIVKGWRATNKQIVNYWYRLEEAALAAVASPGVPYYAGRIKFKTSGSFLICKLPSGRVIVYPYPRIERVRFTYEDDEGVSRTVEKDGLTYQTVHETDNQWGRTKTYGGKLAENVTQATAFDVLADGAYRLEGAGYPLVLTVHDEAVPEISLADLNYERVLSPAGHETKTALEHINAIMAVVPEWAPGLPIESSGWVGDRYRK